MGINKIINKWKNSYKKRYSDNGLINILSQKEKGFRELLEHLPESGEEATYWRNAYSDFLHKHISYLKSLVYLPRAIASKITPRPRWYDYIKNKPNYNRNEILDFRGVKLVKPQNQDDENMYDMIILDVLLQHLLAFGLNEIINVDYDFYSVCPEGPYEFDQVYLSKGDIVIDAGACMGEFSAFATYKGCKPYAFEPMKITRDLYLAKTVEMNPGIVVAPYALSSQKDEFEFSVNLENLGGSFISTIGKEVNFKKNTNIARIEKVKAIDLDSYVNENNLTRVDFIKADIEGAERNMLMGAQSVLKDFSPKLALCTYHLPDDPKVMKELIMEANSAYVVEQKFKKLYAYVPK